MVVEGMGRRSGRMRSMNENDDTKWRCDGPGFQDHEGSQGRDNKCRFVRIRTTTRIRRYADKQHKEYSPKIETQLNLRAVVNMQLSLPCS